MKNLTLSKLDAYNDLRISINKAIERIGNRATANYIEQLLNKADNDNYWTVEGVDAIEEAKKYAPDRWGINYGSEVQDGN